MIALPSTLFYLHYRKSIPSTVSASIKQAQNQPVVPQQTFEFYTILANAKVETANNQTVDLNKPGFVSENCLSA